MKREMYTITFTKNGYEPKVVHISAELEGWYIGNVLIGGWLGMLIIDPISGAMYKIAKEDRTIYETLYPSNGNNTVALCDINNLPEGITTDDLVRIN